MQLIRFRMFLAAEFWHIWKFSKQKWNTFEQSWGKNIANFSRPGVLKENLIQGPEGMEALISPRPNLPEAPPGRQSLIRPWYVAGSSWSKKGYWKGADSPQQLCTSGWKSICSCLANFGDWWGSASLWMDCLLSCNQTITCILVLFASWWPRHVDWYVWVLSKVRFATN